MNKIKLLDWDSNFFNMKIGRIDKFELEENEFLEIIEDFTMSEFDLVYIFDNLTANTISISSDFYSLKEVDTKVVYKKSITDFDVKIENLNVDVLNDISTSDELDLISLALESGHLSRYKTDDNFKKGEFERFYRTWIQNSINKTIADDIFVYRFEDKIVGFATLKYSGDDCFIGLIAVSPNLRGQQIGAKLMEMCFAYGKHMGCKNLYVATQLQNEGACNFYEKFEMIIDEKKKIFHLWKV